MKADVSLKRCLPNYTVSICRVQRDCVRQSRNYAMLALTWLLDTRTVCARIINTTHR